jgi:hypothetical protein
MEFAPLSADDREVVSQILGYLNFSSGASDPQFLSRLNQLYRLLDSPVSEQAPSRSKRRRPKKSRKSAESTPPAIPVWRQITGLLRHTLVELSSGSEAFSNAEQALNVLELVERHVIPEYREFHSDLLVHQTDDELFGPLMLGRVFEAVLKQGGPWDEVDRITRDVIRTLNDFLGHRPVPALETRKHEPYLHEWVRPIPLYIRGVGTAHSRYKELVDATIKILEVVNPSIQRRAQFDPQLMLELALDPRAYDFEHPAHRRPNYQFGEWDPHQITNQGNYSRFVVRQVTLDAILARVTSTDGIPHDELIFEAAGVLAGTILMASGISGHGPGVYDSTVTLMTLLPMIAQYRDEFYEQLVHSLSDAHAVRMQKEILVLRQPFGGARQDLNARLGRARASQMERVKLARIFARMGHLEAAREQAATVNVASARMMCQVDCGLVAGMQAIARGSLDEAYDHAEQLLQLLHRGIECGAIVDPWNILGFDGNFSIFPAMENTVHDHRVDELVEILERLFDFLARLWGEASAGDSPELPTRVSRLYQTTANWWHQFAAHEVSSVEASSAMDNYRAAAEVASALQQWHDKGVSAGNIAFWAPRVANFESPKAYSLVIETLLAKHDFPSARSLLVHWLENSEKAPLEHGETSFNQLAHRWLMELTGASVPGPTRQMESEVSDGGELSTARKIDPLEVWPRIRRFFDFLEANANEYWRIPDFSLGGPARPTAPREQTDFDEEEEDEESEAAELFGAAYENVVFKDSTADGHEGSIFENDESTYDELERERERIEGRLSFIRTMARMWTYAAATLAQWFAAKEEPVSHADELLTTLNSWSDHVKQFGSKLLELSDIVGQFALPTPDGSSETLVQYDRQRVVKEMLQESVIVTRIELSESERFLAAASIAIQPASEQRHSEEIDASAPDQKTGDITEAEKFEATQILSAAFRGTYDEAIQAPFARLCEILKRKHILYVPLTKSGSPRPIMAARARQRLIENLLVVLPRVGHLNETRKLMDTARRMERNFPPGPGAITQYDQLYELGFGEMVESLVRAAAHTPNAEDADDNLLACLEDMTEMLLLCWLEHSKTLRLSTLERVRNKDKWQQLVDFIKRYGVDLFDQGFLNLSNLRAILHEGVECWLDQLEEHDQGPSFRLLEDIGQEVTRDDAVSHLTLVLEAIVENYHEYNDYNSSTTQSDRGDMLYMLLDFLRLLADYERVMWNLKPIIQAHEILVRRGCNESAQRWRRALSERIGNEADVYEKKLAALQKSYAMRMVSVASRIHERFLRPMTIDRMRALVEPAVFEADQAPPHHAFDILADEAALLIREPTGTGLDTPAWLQSIEDEIDRIEQHRRLGAYDIRDILPTDCHKTLDDIFLELEDWE